MLKNVVRWGKYRFRAIIYATHIRRMADSRR